MNNSSFFIVSLLFVVAVVVGFFICFVCSFFIINFVSVTVIRNQGCWSSFVN